MSLIRAVGTICLCILANAPMSWADPFTVFTSRQQFTTDVRPSILETFGAGDCLSPSGVLNVSTPTTCPSTFHVQPGVTYSAAVFGNVFYPGLIIDGGGGFDGGFLDAIRPPDVSASPLTAVFDAPVAAFGFDTNLYMGSSFTVTINADGTETQTFSVAPTGALQFFGFQSSSANIRSVMISGSGVPFLPGTDRGFFSFAIDNFSFGGLPANATPTPEPTTLSLVAAGALMAAARWQRRRACRQHC